MQINLSLDDFIDTYRYLRSELSAWNLIGKDILKWRCYTPVIISLIIVMMMIFPSFYHPLIENYIYRLLLIAIIFSWGIVLWRIEKSIFKQKYSDFPLKEGHWLNRIKLLRHKLLLHYLLKKGMDKERIEGMQGYLSILLKDAEKKRLRIGQIIPWAFLGGLWVPLYLEWVNLKAQKGLSALWDVVPFVLVLTILAIYIKIIIPPFEELTHWRIAKLHELNEILNSCIAELNVHGRENILTYFGMDDSSAKKTD